MVKAASDVNHVPYSVLLNYWRKHFAVTLQTLNARLITQAYLALFDNGGGNLECDFNSTRAFEINDFSLNHLLISCSMYVVEIRYSFHCKTSSLLLSQSISY